MEQIQELLNILKETPQMALWGITIYFLFIIIKISSWIIFLKFIGRRFFDWLISSESNRKGSRIICYFEKEKISSVDSSLLFKLIDTIKGNDRFIHEHKLNDAIQIIKENSKQ